MQVKDYEFIYNINALFDRKIIVYGAGKYGRKMLALLHNISLEADCFCDKNPSQEQVLNYSVISLDELKDKTDHEDCFIIIASWDYCDEILLDMEQKKIDAYICTWYGLKTGIELHIDDLRFPTEFRTDFSIRKKLWFQNYNAYHDLDILLQLNLNPHAIFVYQPAKVGSTTVKQTLIHENIDAVGSHLLMRATNVEIVDQAAAYIADRIKADGVKIITLVREPVARALSYFMNGFTSWYISDVCKSFDLQKEASEWITNILNENEEFKWFDKELKELTGIDIFQYPFDKENGYAWIKEGNIEILVLKLEKLNNNAQVIQEFVGRKEKITLKNWNVGEAKPYKHIYQALKKDIKIPVQVMKDQYENNTWVDHFYTVEEKEAFRDKWDSNILK